MSQDYASMHKVLMVGLMFIFAGCGGGSDPSLVTRESETTYALNVAVNCAYPGQPGQETFFANDDCVAIRRAIYAFIDTHQPASSWQCIVTPRDYATRNVCDTSVR